MLENEKLVTFVEAAKHLPRFNGKRPHANSVWRWARRGLQGVRLECRRVGSRFVTSIEALDRFTAKLAELELPDRPRPPKQKTQTTKARQRSIDRAKATLERAGI